MTTTIIENVSFIQDGEIIERLVLDVNGHNVQVVAYDKGPCVVVKVDEQVKQMDISQVDKFIRDNT